jgi:hypothetical protein
MLKHAAFIGSVSVSMFCWNTSAIGGAVPSVTIFLTAAGTCQT